MLLDVLHPVVKFSRTLQLRSVEDNLEKVWKTKIRRSNVTITDSQNLLIAKSVAV